MNLLNKLFVGIVEKNDFRKHSFQTIPTNISTGIATCDDFFCDFFSMKSKGSAQTRKSIGTILQHTYVVEYVILLLTERKSEKVEGEDQKILQGPMSKKDSGVCHLQKHGKPQRDGNSS